MTSFVDLDPSRTGGLLGLAPGCSGASVRGWLDLQSKEFRAGIKVVAIDPSAPFAAVLRDKKLLPNATLVVDHWHLHRLANLMVTRVRQRVTHDRLGHRGRRGNDVWAYRQLLLRNGRSRPRLSRPTAAPPKITTSRRKKRPASKRSRIRPPPSRAAKSGSDCVVAPLVYVARHSKGLDQLPALDRACLIRTPQAR
jgi:transposase